jgi:acid phosphatase family membrane protein YuiD
VNIFSSPYIVVPFICWLIAQTTKLALRASRGDFSWKYLYKSGNMPSSHTTIVVALLVVLGFLNGVESAEFGIGAVFSLIVIYDAFGVRRAVGEQGGVLARLIELSRTPKAEREAFKITEVLGHTPLEVLAGALIGLLTSTLLMFRYWPESLRQVFGRVGETERLVYYAIFGLMFVGGLILARRYSGRFRRLPTGVRVRRVARNALLTPAVLGALVVWLESEGIQFFANKAWIYFILVSSLLWLILGYFLVLKRARSQLLAEAGDYSFAKRAERRKRRKRRKK